jgi:serine/threonine protein kinase
VPFLTLAREALWYGSRHPIFYCHILTPSKIGKYEIVRELGRGATSAVFEAVDPFTGRHVAI